MKKTKLIWEIRTTSNNVWNTVLLVVAGMTFDAKYFSFTLL